MTAKSTATHEQDLAAGAMPQCWQDYEDVLSAHINRVIAYGQPGTGKTYFAEHYHLPYEGGSFTLTCTETMTEFDVIGGPFPNAEGGFDMVDGLVFLAMEGNGKVGARLILDEADKASGDVLGWLLKVCDSDQSCRITHPVTKKVYTPRPGFEVIVTTNLQNMHELPIAFADRFPVRIDIDTPHPDAIKALPADLRLAAVKLGRIKDRESRASLRAFFAFAQMREHMAPQRAAKLAFGEAIAEQILAAVQVSAIEGVTEETAAMSFTTNGNGSVGAPSTVFDYEAAQEFILEEVPV